MEERDQGGKSLHLVSRRKTIFGKNLPTVVFFISGIFLSLSQKKFSLNKYQHDRLNYDFVPPSSRFVPKVTSRNNDMAKQQLQERMSGMKEYPDLDKYALSTKEKHRRDPNKSKSHSNDRVAELLKEINERVEWIKEMDLLGEGKKHRQVIDAQVTERLNEIRRLEERMARQKRDGLQQKEECGTK